MDEMNTRFQIEEITNSSPKKPSGLPSNGRLSEKRRKARTIGAFIGHVIAFSLMGLFAVGIIGGAVALVAVLWKLIRWGFGF